MLSDATIKKTGNRIDVSYGDDSSVYAEFFMDAIEVPFESEQQGRPIYRNVEMVRIVFAGDNSKEVVKMSHEGNPPYKDRFPRQYEAFKEQREQVADGTPIEQWPPISKAQALELKALKIHTVEMLAAMPDTGLVWMGARQLRENAKAWLAEAESGAETISLRNQIESLQVQIEAMKNQSSGFAASQKQEAVLESAPAAPMLEASDIKPFVSKMRGRPKKVTDGADISSINAASGE